MAILARAYARRKQFEARLIAIEVGKMLAGATGSAGGANSRNARTFATKSGQMAQRVTPAAMLNMMGMGVE